MHVRMMQRIDYWVGVPICAALHLIHKVLALLPCRMHETRPEKFLLIELSEMGSAIIAHSAIEQLKSERPKAEIYFLIFSKNRESVEVLGSIPPERIITVDASSFIRFAWSMLGVLAKCRELGVTTVIDLELFSRCTAIISYLSGASRRVGFSNFTSEGLYRGRLLTHPVYYNHHQHMAYNFLALARSAVQSEPPEVPALKENVQPLLRELPAFVADADELGGLRKRVEKVVGGSLGQRRLLLLNPDPGDALPIRGWPIDRFAAAARVLLERHPDLLCLVVGLPQSKALADRIIADVRSERCFNFAGATDSLRELIALCAMSDVLLTNDSGPAHMAALTEAQSVVLFGPETPALYGALGKRTQSLYAGLSCSPCLNAANHRHTLCRNNVCLQAITVAQVVEAVERGLSARAAAAPEAAEGRCE